MAKGKTKSGFEFDVDPVVFNDWDVLDYLSEMSDGNDLIAPKFVKKVLGKEQGKALVDHCRDESGRAPTKAVIEEVLDIINTLKEGKN